MAFRYAICTGGRAKQQEEFVVALSCGIITQFVSQT